MASFACTTTIFPIATASSSSAKSSSKSSHLSFLETTTTSIPISLKLSNSYSCNSQRSFVVNNVQKTRDPVLSSKGVGSSSLDSKPTILVPEKLGDAGLEVLRGFGNVECVYDLSPDQLCSKISSWDALIVRSGTKVTRQVFEAAKGRLRLSVGLVWELTMRICRLLLSLVALSLMLPPPTQSPQHSTASLCLQPWPEKLHRQMLP